MGLARRWDVDRLEFVDEDSGEISLLVAESDHNDVHIETAYTDGGVGLNRDEVIRLRDWLTEWLNAPP
jgi:hypothetical protein